jgi:hypothetical protein
VTIPSDDIPPDQRLFVLGGSSASLDDVGAPGFSAAIGIDPNGDRVVFLAADDALGVRMLTTAESVEHERTGRLPFVIAKRVASVPVRCGRITTSGSPCRTRVKPPGRACHRHRNGDADG